MEILCRRIDKHDHVSRSSSMEVVVLSAVYASQRREWKEAFQSLSDPTQRAVDTDGGLDAELQEASVEAQEEAGRRAEQVRLMNATLGQARSLQAASPCTSIDSDKIFENTRSIGSSVISQENIPVDNNARACHPAATVPAPSASSAGGALKPGAAEELVISFDRVLDLDSMLGEEPEVDDYSPQPTVVVDTGQVQLLAISELPLRSPVDSSPTHERQAPLTASFGEIGDSPSSADAQAISLRPSSKLSPDSGGRQEYRRESNSGMIVSSSNVVSKMETRKRHGVVNDEKLGYLFKRGRIRSMSFLKPWSYRWCTLNVANGLLSYHIEENGSRYWKGSVNVCNGTVFELDSKLVGKQFAFDVSCVGEDSQLGESSSSGTITLAALYKSELDNWLYALSLVPGCEVVRLEDGAAVGALFPPASTALGSRTGAIGFIPTPFVDAEPSNVTQAETKRETPFVLQPSVFPPDTIDLSTIAETKRETPLVLQPSVFPPDTIDLSTVDHGVALETNSFNSGTNLSTVEDAALLKANSLDREFRNQDCPVSTAMQVELQDIADGVAYQSEARGSSDTAHDLDFTPTTNHFDNEKGEVARALVESPEDLTLTLPVPRFSSSPAASDHGCKSDVGDGFFPPDIIGEDEEEQVWLEASAQALLEVMSEDSKKLKQQNDLLLRQLDEKSGEVDTLRLQIAELSSSYESELQGLEQMADAQVAAASDLVSELQTKLFAAQHELTKAERAPAVAPNDLQATAVNREHTAEREAAIALQADVLALMSSDGEEPLPLLPMSLWPRELLLRAVVAGIMAADPWKKPLVLLRNTTDHPFQTATSGKTTLAAMACRSMEIVDKFQGNVFWIHAGHKDYACGNFGRRDSEHCALLELLADKIRKRLCPWLVRKLRRSQMSARDWRLYISDLLHCTRSGLPVSQIDAAEHQQQEIHFPCGQFLLVLDGVQQPSIVAALGFLGMVTVVTAHSNWDFHHFGTIVEVPCSSAADIHNYDCRVNGAPAAKQLKKSVASFESNIYKVADNRSMDEFSGLGGGEQYVCVLKTAVCGHMAPQSQSVVMAADLRSSPWISDHDEVFPQRSRISGNLSSAFIKLSQDEQYRLIALGSLPPDTTFPFHLVAAMWEIDILLARQYLYTLFQGSWVSLLSPGDGFCVHHFISEFLCGQLERLPMLARRHLREKALAGLYAWIVSPAAFDTALLRYCYDWSYIALWAHLGDIEAIGKYQEQFLIATKNMKYLTRSDRLLLLYYIDYAATLVMRIPQRDEDRKAWCEDWLRKSMQLKMDLMSEVSVGSDLYVLRDVFPVLLDCNTKHMIYADSISYLQHMTSYQYSLDATAGRVSIASAELLVLQAALHWAAGRIHRAGEMYQEASQAMRDGLSIQGSPAFLDSIWTSQVLCKIKQVGQNGHLTDIAVEEFQIANEMLDEAMSGRKAFLGCEEHPRLTDLIQLSGEVWARTDNGDAMARKLFKAAMMMRCLQHGEAHPASIALFEQMALSLESVGKPLSSLPYWQKTVELAKGTFGLLHPQTVCSVVTLCCNLYGLSREEEAIAVLRRPMLRARQLTIGSENTAAAGNQLSDGQASAEISPSLYGLLVLTYAYVAMSPGCVAMKAELPKARKMLIEALKLMHSRRLNNISGTSEQDDAIAAAMLFKLGAICENSGDFNRAKKYYNSASTSFAEVGDMYHLCSILSLVRLSVCEVNLGEMEDSILLLEAASEALDDVILNGIPNSLPDVPRHGVFAVVDITADSRFFCFVFRAMDWQGLVLPHAAHEMKVAVDKLLCVASENMTSLT